MCCLPSPSKMKTKNSSYSYHLDNNIHLQFSIGFLFNSPIPYHNVFWKDIKHLDFKQNVIIYYIIHYDYSNMLMYWTLKSIKTIEHFGKTHATQRRDKNQKSCRRLPHQWRFWGDGLLNMGMLGQYLHSRNYYIVHFPSLETTKNASLRAEDSTFRT